MGLGLYRKEPLHPPVLPVGVPLRQRATVHGIAVKGVVKTCREGRDGQEVLTHLTRGFSHSPSHLGFTNPPLAAGSDASRCFPLWEGDGKHVGNKETGAAAAQLSRALCELSQPGAVHCQGLCSGKLRGTTKPQPGRSSHCLSL